MPAGLVSKFIIGPHVSLLFHCPHPLFCFSPSPKSHQNTLILQEAVGRAVETPREKQLMRLSSEMCSTAGEHCVPDHMLDPTLGSEGGPSALSVFLVEVWWRKSIEEANVQGLGVLTRFPMPGL